MNDPGDLLDVREIPPDVPGSRAWTVRFATEDGFGRPTESTGVVVAPEAELADRPVVVWCHGTTGLGDGSVPSRQPNPAGELITHPEPVGPEDVDRGVPGMTDYLAAGAVVVAPDYQGLGTPGFHHYCVHATGARDAVFAVRAAQRVAGTGAGRRLGVLGWSEGGGMALGVSEAPDAVLGDLDLRATSVFAPGVPALVLAAGRTEMLEPRAEPDPHVIMYLTVLGWLFDDLEPIDVLTPATAALMDEVWEALPVHLVGERLAALAAAGDPVLRPDPVDLDRWIARMRSVSAGTGPVRGPVYVATGLADDLLPPAWQDIYVDAATGFGADITRDIRPGDDHCEIPFTAGHDAARFLLDRLGV